MLYFDILLQVHPLWPSVMNYLVPYLMQCDNWCADGHEDHTQQAFLAPGKVSSFNGIVILLELDLFTFLCGFFVEMLPYDLCFRWSDNLCKCFSIRLFDVFYASQFFKKQVFCLGTYAFNVV